MTSFYARDHNRLGLIDHFAQHAIGAVKSGYVSKARVNASLAAHYAFMLHPELRG